MKCGYIRVSTKSQEDGYSLDSQKARLVAVGCKAIYSDTMSGRLAKRPGYQQLLERIRNGEIYEVVTIRLDRLGRSTKEILNFYDTLREHNVKLTILEMPFELGGASGEFSLTIWAAIAQLESKMLSGKIKASIEHRKALEIPIRPCFGYATSRAGLVASSEWLLARALVDTFLSVGTLRGTIWRYREEHPDVVFPDSPRGLKKWLLSPVLRGHLVYAERTLYNKHQPLISPDESDQIQALYEQSKAQRGYGSKGGLYPLSGLVYCVCGNKCRVFPKQSGEAYYACVGYYDKEGECCLQRIHTKNQYAKASNIEAQVISALASAASEIADRVLSAKADIAIPPEALALEQQIKQLQAMLQSGVGVETLQDTIQKLEAERQRYLEVVVSQPVVSEDKLKILYACSQPGYWLGLEASDKKVLFHWLVDKVVVRRSEVVDVVLKL